MNFQQQPVLEMNNNVAAIYTIMGAFIAGSLFTHGISWILKKSKSETKSESKSETKTESKSKTKTESETESESESLSESNTEKLIFEWEKQTSKNEDSDSETSDESESEIDTIYVYESIETIMNQMVDIKHQINKLEVRLNTLEMCHHLRTKVL